MLFFKKATLKYNILYTLFKPEYGDWVFAAKFKISK
jgi:hypothetical protein